MSLELSKKMSRITPSYTLEITAKAKALKAAGKDIVSFGAGEPDFNTPLNIQNAGIEAIKSGKTRYTTTTGIVELKEAIIDKLKRDQNIDYKKSEIVVSNGAKQSLFNALSVILDTNEEVILPTPYWVSYPEMVKLAGGVPLYVEVKEEDGFIYDLDALESAYNKNVKAILINSPNNPTGAVYNEKTLIDIYNWAKEKDIFIISDEIYEELIYGDTKHFSVASICEDAKKRTILINGMSKAYAMTGWRIGYLAADEAIVGAINKFQAHSTSNACSISQYASVEGLNGDKKVISEMREAFNKRRIYMVDRVNKINGLSCKEPKGAFYVMINITECIGKTFEGEKIENSLDFSNILLERSDVAVIPGKAFGDERYIRLSYATDLDSIEKGLDRIDAFVQKLK